MNRILASCLLGLVLFGLVDGQESSLDAPDSTGATVGGPIAPDGTAAFIDMPREWHVKNKGGSDGAGLCVFASLRHAGLYQDDPVFAGLFEWMTQHPGGSYPEKTDRMIAQFCSETGLTKPRYLQVEGTDLDVLVVASKSGRVPGVTYGYSPSGRYNRKRISHMVSLVHADGTKFAVLDNNYPGSYEWLSRSEFSRVYTDPSGQGWSVILLTPGAPPKAWN